MMQKVQREIEAIIGAINEKRDLISNAKATIGFDGFLDNIMSIVRSKEPSGLCAYYESMDEFGGYISHRHGKSCSLELEERTVKIGGNMPIMANALGSLGISVNCVGAMGYPLIHPIFRGMSKNCSLLSFSDPGETTALEFNDGKIMLANISPLHKAGWDALRGIIGLERIVSCFNESDVIALVNWSEPDCSTNIWEGIINEVLPAISRDRSRAAFFDLSDCSKRNPDEIRKALSLIKTFRQKYRVILGLNDNEALLIHGILYSDGGARTGSKASAGNTVSAEDNIASVGSGIYRDLGIDVLVIHTSRYSMAWSNGPDVSKADTVFVDNPAISTGGGDNFNAGFCLGLLFGMDISSCQLLANSVSGYYVGSGRSPDLDELADYMESNLK